MRLPFFNTRRGGTLMIGGLALAVGLGSIGLGARVLAQNVSAAEAVSEAPVASAQKKKRHVAQKAPAAAPAASKRADGDAQAPAPSPGKAGAPPADKPRFEFSAQLDRAGASSCKAQVNALAGSTMASVESFNTVSSWSQVNGDQHPVSIAIGQKYASGSPVPYGISEVIAAPNAKGGCDGLTVQVMPSPLSCAKVREAISARHGRQVGDLAGIPLMQEAGANTMLVPTAADTCVLVATRTAYAK